jgi:putative sigma-54 modulation protein
MISQIKVSGIAYEVDDATRKYAIKRIGRLDSYIPRHARKSLSVEIKLEQVNHDHGNKYEAEVIFDIPGGLITAKDSTSNIFAAIDIVEAKIRAQLHDYKEANIAHIGKRRMMSRFKKTFKREL